jgi:hypothetical protein
MIEIWCIPHLRQIARSRHSPFESDGIFVV